jgi:hypothetical protein
MTTWRREKWLMQILNPDFGAFGSVVLLQARGGIFVRSKLAK